MEHINELGKVKSVQHLIRTTKLPNVMPMSRTPERLRLIVKKQIDEMLKNKVIRPRTSPFCVTDTIFGKEGRGTDEILFRLSCTKQCDN
jgi:hypothetical protein